MKRGMVLFFTLVLMAAMAVTTANAQQYVHTDTFTLTGGVPGTRVDGITFKDNGTLINGGNDDILRAWDITTGTQRWSKHVGDNVYAVALPSHDPHFIAYSGGPNDTDIRMRYSSDANWRGEVVGHTKYVQSLAFKPNSYLLASGSF